MTVIIAPSPPRSSGMIPYRKMGEIDYDSLDFDPYESVKKPDGMEEHLEQIEMVNLLRAHFADYEKRANVFWDYNSNICYDRDDLTRHISPDVYAAFGVDAAAIRSRLIYLPWEAGKPPDFVMEIATISTWREDMEVKPAIYEIAGAAEYWTLDPTGGRYCGVPVTGRRLVDGKYQNIELTAEPDGVLKGYSAVLGASVAWKGGEPRLYDRASGKYLENMRETMRARRIEEIRRDPAAAARRESEIRRDEGAKLLAEVKARVEAEEENRRLREIIRRLESR